MRCSLNVATIAANNDKEIGTLIAKAIETVGNSGVVTVSESQDMNTTLEVVNGLDVPWEIKWGPCKWCV